MERPQKGPVDGKTPWEKVPGKDILQEDVLQEDVPRKASEGPPCLLCAGGEMAAAAARFGSLGELPL